MTRKKIELSGEQIHQAAENCETFSNEYWRSMTPPQQEQLTALRQRKLSAAAYRVGENERAAGIENKMAELRSLRSQNDEVIRDLYFAIPDDAARITAIKDLFEYERLRRSYDTSMVYEAYYRYEDVRNRLIFGWTKWPEVKKLSLSIAVLAAVGLIVRLIWPDIKETVDRLLVAGFVLVLAYGVYYDLNLRRLESHYFLLWEFEKLKRGIDDDRDLSRRPLRYELFSNSERQSGRRAAAREAPR